MARHTAPVLLLAWAGAACTAAANAVGANVMGNTDYEATVPFVDLIKQSRSFGQPDKPWITDGVELDAEGWPRQDFGVIVFDGSWVGESASCPMNGTYLLRCVGNATVSTRDTGVTVKNVQFAEGNTTAEIQCSAEVTQLSLSFTDTEGGIRNLSILQPGYSWDDATGFSRPFLGQLRRFSLLRFMDWGMTNGSPVKEWSDRALPTSAQWTGATGVPVETMVALCNTLGKDMWVNVPHLATDDYVVQLAQLLQGSLHPGLTLYVENSNELWNYQFPQAKWNLQQAQMEVAQGGSPLNYSGCDEPTNKWYWANRRTAKRLKEISDVFRQVFGPSAVGARSRVRPVLAGQMGALTNRLGLDMVNALWGPPKRFFGAIAVAPYFDLGADRGQGGLSVEQILHDLESQVDAQRPTDLPNDLRQSALNSAWYGLPLHGYEGGPDTAGSENIPAKKQANLDPRLQPIVEAYLRNWYSIGAAALNWFTAGAQAYDGKYGAWAVTDCMQREDTPKLRGIDAVIAADVAATVGDAVPGDVNATAMVPRDRPGHQCAFGPYLCGRDAGTQADFLLRTASAVNTSLVLHAAGENMTLGISLNNGPVSTVRTLDTGDRTRFQPVAPVRVAFPSAGLHALRIQFIVAPHYASAISMLSFAAEAA